MSDSNKDIFMASIIGLVFLFAMSIGVSSCNTSIKMCTEALSDPGIPEQVKVYMAQNWGACK